MDNSEAYRGLRDLQSLYTALGAITKAQFYPTHARPEAKCHPEWMPEHLRNWFVSIDYWIICQSEKEEWSTPHAFSKYGLRRDQDRNMTSQP
jgi:hypothetical protein